MGIADRESVDPDLPERHLLRDGDRLQGYATAFLRGEITAEQYGEMTLAEINRRAPIDPLLPLGEAEPVVLRIAQEAPPPVPEAPHVEPRPPVRSESDRAIVLARAFVGGRIRPADFLRLIRDC